MEHHTSYSVAAVDRHHDHLFVWTVGQLRDEIARRKRLEQESPEKEHTLPVEDAVAALFVLSAQANDLV